MVVFGTRPEAIKLAPVIRALEGSSDLEPLVVVTAQHREILDQVLALFGILPKHDLAIIQPRQTLTEITTRALDGLGHLLEHEQPDVVVVQGDTTSAFAGALAAFYRQVPVAHVEAGLRSGNVRAPYPEEMNRRLVSQLGALHLAPTQTARQALLAEGIGSTSIVVTGNTVIDALQHTIGLRIPFTDPALADLDEDPRRILLVTAHRRESWGEGMRAIGAALAHIAAAHPDLLVVFPIHPNPRVRETILPALAGHPNIRALEPLPYGDFARLMRRSHLILTDSGGIQEEGPSLGKPVLVTRTTTERPEAVVAGTARLVGSDRDAIVEAVRELLHDETAYSRMANAVNPYGDGRSAPRVEVALARLLGFPREVEEFRL